jgi:hypothetical protein
MEKPAMRIAWMLGWAAPEAWFAPIAREFLPAADHVFVSATPEAIGQLAAAGACDWIVGYSLGSLLLLEAADRLAGRRVALLAPIFAFPSEEGLGGRISRTQVRQLARWLRHEPLAALADFYERAVLHIPSGQHPGTPEHLLWGLERLEKERVEPRLPPGWSAWCGEKDALLNAERLHELEPAVVVVPGGTHHPRELIRAWTETLA